MDNEGLLVWAEYDVERARAVLQIAEAHIGELHEIVRIEKENKRQMTDCVAYMEKLGIPSIIYLMANSVEELIAMIADKKAFLRRCGVHEEELKP